MGVVPGEGWDSKPHWSWYQGKWDEDQSRHWMYLSFREFTVKGNRDSGQRGLGRLWDKGRAFGEKENVTVFLCHDGSDRVNKGNSLLRGRKKITAEEVSSARWERAQGRLRREVGLWRKLSSHVIIRTKTHPCGYRCRDFGIFGDGRRWDFSSDIASIFSANQEKWCSFPKSHSNKSQSCLDSRSQTMFSSWHHNGSLTFFRVKMKTYLHFRRSHLFSSEYC